MVLRLPIEVGAFLVFIAASITPIFVSSDALGKSVRFNCHFLTYASPDGLKKAEKDFRLEFTFDDITGDAVLLGNNGLSPVRVHSGAAGITFSEVIGTGVIQTTTIASSGAAVHSRHTILRNNLVPSQYYGQCG